MKRREVELPYFGEMIERAAKEPLVAPVLAPAVVMFIDVRPVYAPRRQIFPLDSRVQNVQYVVKDLVIGGFAPLPALSLRKVGCDKTVELFARDFGRQFVVFLRWWTLGLLFSPLGVHKKRVQY